MKLQTGEQIAKELNAISNENFFAFWLKFNQVLTIHYLMGYKKRTKL
jgi:hypothetical protein